MNEPRDSARRPIATALAAVTLLAVLGGSAQAAEPALPETAPGASASAPAATPVPWSSLSADQQHLLSRFGNQWNTLPPARQQALARGSERWLGMSTQQKDMARERFQKWRALPPEQRSALRERWERFRSLPPEQQAAVRQSFRRFQQLPPERRQMLREQWRNASPAERQSMVERMRERRRERMEGMQPPPGGGPRARAHGGEPRMRRLR